MEKVEKKVPKKAKKIMPKRKSKIALFLEKYPNGIFTIIDKKAVLK
jgi:hypothetical protein